MINQRLKFLGYSVAMQEVPNEISLVINISGCPYKCKGCHSKYLWEYKGNYVDAELFGIIKQYENLITCVCFMGGEQNQNELISHLKHIKNKGYKTCLYSGCDDLNYLYSVLPYLDYLKYGSYNEKFLSNNYYSNGLKLASTNQKFLLTPNQ